MIKELSEFDENLEVFAEDFGKRGTVHIYKQYPGKHFETEVVLTVHLEDFEE